MMNIALRYTIVLEHLLHVVSKLASRILKLIGLEAAIWILGLVFLVFINDPQSIHFTVCPFANLGIDFCPGCGLGNSISYLFRGDLSASFHAHPLGIFALIIITMRIITIIKNNRRMYA